MNQRNASVEQFRGEYLHLRENSREPFLELDRVSRYFSVRSGMLEPDSAMLRAVHDVSLQVHRGETLGLVGESGCGKSTLARILVRLLAPSSGDVRLEGQSIWNGPRSVVATLPRRIQMIFQDPVSSLNPRMRIGRSIQEAMDVHRIGTRNERRQKVKELLSLVGMQPEAYDRFPHEFSGGQRQRIAVARALILNPDLVVCDEPVSALDVSVQAQVLNLLRSLQQSFSLTYVFISHDLSVVGHVADRIAVMYLGQIVEQAPAGELFANPMHPYTQALLEAVPVPVPGFRQGHPHLAGELPSPVSPPSGCPFHPRCPSVLDICRQESPQWTAHQSGNASHGNADGEHVSGEHAVFCHLY